MAHIWKVCPFGHHMVGTSWTQMEICPFAVDCDQMPQELFSDEDGSPSDNNHSDDECMAPFKDESV